MLQREGSSKWIADVSDRIRSPVDQLLKLTRQLLDSGIDPTHRDQLRGILFNAETVAGHVDDLLDYLSIEAGRLELDHIDFDLRVMMDGLARDLLLRSEERGVSLSARVHHDVPSRMRGDPGRLRQILNSLAGHAIRRSTGGEVLLEVDILEEDDSSAHIRFGVTATMGEAGEEEAAGLAVSIAHHLTAMMEGRVGQEWPEGGGFSVWFTAVLSKRQTTDTLFDEPDDGDVSSHYALVICDDLTSRVGLVDQLQAWGCRHAEVTSAEEGVEKVQQAAARGDPFTVVLVDLNTRGADLAGLAGRIRNDPDLTATRLVLVTSTAQRGDAARMKEAGYSAYLTQPLRWQELRTGLEALSGATRGLITRHWLAEHRKHSRRILLVENNPVDYKLDLRILDRLGYRVDVVGGGAEALEVLAAEHRDLVLMSVQLPDSDGIATTRKIRSTDSDVLWSDIPIIGITTTAASEDPERCVEAGMDGCLMRPIDPEDLRKAIERQLERDTEPAPTGAPAQVSALYNRRELLERLNGDEQLCQDVLRTFIDGSPPLVESIREALDVGDRPNVERNARTLMDAAANVTAEGVRSLAFRIVQAGKSGSLAEAGALLEALEELIGRLGSYLDR